MFFERILNFFPNLRLGSNLIWQVGFLCYVNSYSLLIIYWLEIHHHFSKSMISNLQWIKKFQWLYIVFLIISCIVELLGNKNFLFVELNSFNRSCNSDWISSIFMEWMGGLGNSYWNCTYFIDSHYFECCSWQEVSVPSFSHISIHFERVCQSI